MIHIVFTLFLTVSVLSASDKDVVYSHGFRPPLPEKSLFPQDGIFRLNPDPRPASPVNLQDVSISISYDAHRDEDFDEDRLDFDYYRAAHQDLTQVTVKNLTELFALDVILKYKDAAPSPLSVTVKKFVFDAIRGRTLSFVPATTAESTLESVIDTFDFDAQFIRMTMKGDAGLRLHADVEYHIEK